MEKRQKFELALFIISAIIVSVWMFSLTEKTISTGIKEITNETDTIDCSIDCTEQINNLIIKSTREYLASKNESEKREYEAIITYLQIKSQIIQTKDNSSGDEQITLWLNKYENYSDTDFYNSHKIL